jgi:CubicO group peptidase (beta-lactamase class C family)
MELGWLTVPQANCFETPLLTFEHGEGWDYSCGIDWAGQMVERATGSARLGDYMSEHIWKPLGMASKTFRLR